MKGFSPFGFPIGLSTGFWFIVGIIRTVTEIITQYKTRNKKIRNKYKVSDVAVIVPAHNEQLVIADCIKALKQSFKKNQIYVASDGSVDKTYLEAWKEGITVIGIHPGAGKAKALIHIIERFKLYKRYKFIFIVDADTKIDKIFIRRALPFFNDPDIGVVFGTARIKWPQHIIPKLKYYFIAYRERLNRMLQFFLIYGQTWKHTNANFVIPGFAVIYRTKILQQLEIDTPGLLIEDFNLAFQVHKKRLCKVGYSPILIGWDQHPDNLIDYWKQVRRWNIGFFQTVKRNGFWPSSFYISLFVFNAEVTINSMFTLFIPFLVLYLLGPFLSPMPIFDQFENLYKAYGPYQYLSLREIVVNMFWYDFGMTVIIGLMGRKPQFIFYGLFFFIMHFITSLILISAIIPGFFGSSSGRWISPKRHTIGYAGVKQ